VNPTTPTYVRVHNVAMQREVLSQGSKSSDSHVSATK
jgi:hypothetical protein